MKKSINRFSRSGTYISNIAIGRLIIKKHIQMIIGGFFTTIFVYGLVVGLIGHNEKLREGLVTYIVMLVPSVLLFINGIKNGRKADIAFRYDSIFMCDIDGVLKINDIAKQIGKPHFKVLSELEWLFEKGMFHDCILQRYDVPCVVLLGREGSNTSFVNVVCEKCNGITRLRVGTNGKCEYCGNSISSKKIN